MAVWKDLFLLSPQHQLLSCIGQEGEDRDARNLQLRKAGFGAAALHYAFREQRSLSRRQDSNKGFDHLGYEAGSVLTKLGRVADAASAPSPVFLAVPAQQHTQALWGRGHTSASPIAAPWASDKQGL